MGQNIKRIAAVALAAALALALAGCTTQVVKESKPSVSASDTSASSSSSSSSSTNSSVNWTSAMTADAAAKGAGLSSFGAPARTVIADFVFTNPAFAYTEHVAQATYEVDGSAKLIVRKAEGSHIASITDHEASEYPQKWSNTYEGYDVTSHGDKQGAASICVWNDGTEEYGVTIESLSSSSVTMDAEDLDDIVKAVKAANSEQAASTQQASSSEQAASTQQASSSEQTASTQQASNKSGDTPDFDVESFVWSNGLGEYLRYYYTTVDGQGYWAVVTRGANGGEYTTYADMQGDIVQSGSSPDYDGVDFNIESFVQQYGLGTFQRYYWVQGEDGTGYWGIVTIGDDGAEHTTYVDDWGNMIQNVGEVGSVADSAASGPDFDVESFVWSNGLGEYENCYWVQGSGDSGCWAIVTQGADGAEYITYVDDQGNIVQGGA